MKFLPFFLISLVLALVFNGLEAASDDLDKLFLEAKKWVDWQDRRITRMRGLLNLLRNGQKVSLQAAEKFEHSLKAVKNKDLKLRQETVEKAEKSLGKATDDLKSQYDKLEIQLDGVKALYKQARHQEGNDAYKALYQAKDEYDSQEGKVKTVENLIRSEKTKNEKHAAHILSGEGFLRDIEDERKLQLKNIPKADETFDKLKEKYEKQAEDLASVEPLPDVDDGAKQAEVEAAKKLLRELQAEINVQVSKFLPAESLINLTNAVFDSHLKKFQAVAPLIDAVKLQNGSDPHLQQIENLLHDLE